MAKFDVYDLSMKKVSEIELSDDVFAQKPNPHLLYEAAKMRVMPTLRPTSPIVMTSSYV